MLNKLPSKEKDPVSFTIPCDIGHLHINNALADLGASISLMPYMMYEKLGLGEQYLENRALELADRSIHKQDAKPRLIRWVLLLQGFNIEIKDKKGAENLAAVSSVETLEYPKYVENFAKDEIVDKFLVEPLMNIEGQA
ncbi:DNA-directed DNA polymerase [Tanacetum coccineum]|uniref:DNA-directed DNA polymerase n=1 Tax=Tanacetum coccineum TaxID=301880 RepID=A0ABQ5D8N7_9ASTR